MRFLVLVVKTNTKSETGCKPSEQLLADMIKFNDELAKAGVLEACDGLQPSSDGARVKYTGGQSLVVDGPFTETKELVAGYWIWKCASLEEALAWARKCPPLAHDDEASLEIRPIKSPEEFPLSTAAKS